ncbi:hypothetical protein KM043_016578 [Ampulex compressa]|nr:hypothetical protein KM043_016578 [Ampulex compressa]
MLARHLLFIATRRPHNTLLAIQSDSVPSHALIQPPPYIGPPKPDDRQKDQKIKETLKDPQANQRAQSQNEKQPNYHQQQPPYAQDIYSQESRQNVSYFDNNQKYLEKNRVPNYNEYQRACDRQAVQMHNARNQQLCVPGKDLSQQFYTLPSRRAQREVDPPRSVTPDITRGLGRGSLSTMHMLARQGQKSVAEQDPQSNVLGSQSDMNRRHMPHVENKNRLVQCRQPTVDVRNRFATPLNLTAFGYRFFASSPISDPVMKSASTDALKHNPISPIGHHGYGSGLKSSMSTGRSTPTVAERLALTTGSNCSSPVSNNSGRSTPVQTSSGRNTPTNLILSPTKSTMSNEELFAAIHKSKKRLNIKDDSENLSPYGSMNSLIKTPAGSRHSWSPESQKPPEMVQNVSSPSATSRLDFKRLLLQQSVKAGPIRLSAAEQLKLSRQQCQQQQSSANNQQTPLAKVLSPRSVWRFQTPRTNVLSSTIIEDTAAEEKAMKPSPENTSPLSRLNTRRQLDLGGNPTSASYKENTYDYGDRLSSQGAESSDVKLSDVTTESQRRAVPETRSTDPANRNILRRGPPSDHKIPVPQSDSVSAAIQYSPSSETHAQKSQAAISAFESRRISNQLARAQFLASTPTSVSQGQSAYFRKRFRARSESPQHAITQNVARSPSAPTLETAL